MSPKTQVYVLEPSAEPETCLGNGLQALLTNYGIHVEAFTDVDAFHQALQAGTHPDSCLLLTLDSTDSAAIQLVSRLRDELPALPIIVLGDDIDPDMREQFVRAGAVDLVNKGMVDAYVFTRLSKVLPGDTSLPQTAASRLQLADGTTVTLRMITPEDAEIEQQFVTALSDRSRYLRFFSGLRKLPPFMLRHLTNTQFPVSYALIATVMEDGREKQIGVARYAPTEEEGIAEFAVVVADAWQGCGIASQLLRYIIAAATVAGLDRLEGLVLRENRGMLKLARKLGFEELPESGEGQALVKVVKWLRKPEEDGPLASP